MRATQRAEARLAYARRHWRWYASGVAVIALYAVLTWL